MPPIAANKRRVLFVDDEIPFLEIIGEAMQAYSRGAWQIELASNTSKALAILQSGPVHLVVVDIQMPVVDGIQFLKLLKRKYPSIPRVILTGHLEPDHQAACQSHGAELILEKPGTPEGLEVVHSALDELAQWQPESGFQGVLKKVGLQDVLQMECLARSSLILEISANGETGQIFIEQGAIVHSQVGDLKGEPAFNQLLGLSGGQFNLKPFSEPPERTISGSWEFLLMEAARMKDEILNAEAEQAEAARVAELPPTGDRTPSAQTQVATESSTDFIVVSEGATETEILSQMTAAGLTGLAMSDTSFGTESFVQDSIPPEATPPAPPRIEEFVITTGRGEVIHDFQCDRPEERLQFMEFVRQKSRQVCQGLPVGDFERLELEGLEARMVVRTEGEHVYLLRALRERPGVQVEPSHV